MAKPRRGRASAVGSFEQLRDLRAKLESMPSVGEAIAARVAPALSAAAQEAFDAGRTPFGGDFGASSVDGRTLDLNESGRLRAGAVAYHVEGRKVRASVGGVPYARYQLKRGFLPRKLPAAWEQTVRAIAQQEIANHLGSNQ
jgi:hypothetical protein